MPPLTGAPLALINGRRAPPPLIATFPLSPELPHTFLRPHAKLKLSPFFASVVSPLHRRSYSSENPSGSSSSAAVGEHRRAPAPTCHILTRCLRALLSAPPQSTVDLSRATGPRAMDPIHRIFLWKINHRNPYILTTLHLGH
jgi:hypothetical protein